MLRVIQSVQSLAWLAAQFEPPICKQAVSRWKQVPLDRVREVESITGIPAYEIRPDIFEPPIIKVQCKQVLSTIGRPEVQQLHGAIERGEHGLFVTLGGFSADARGFERTKPNLRLIDGEALVELIYTHYEKVEPRYQMLLPLMRSYVPGPVISSLPS